MGEADLRAIFWLFPEMRRGGYLLRDSPKDRNPVYDACAALDGPLAAKRKRPGAGLGIGGTVRLGCTPWR